jgi:hypothetical protein
VTPQSSIVSCSSAAETAAAAHKAKEAIEPKTRIEQRPELEPVATGEVLASPVVVKPTTARGPASRDLVRETTRGGSVDSEKAPAPKPPVAVETDAERAHRLAALMSPPSARKRVRPASPSNTQRPAERPYVQRQEQTRDDRGHGL